jgi:hypothetical protein
LSVDEGELKRRIDAKETELWEGEPTMTTEDIFPIINEAIKDFPIPVSLTINNQYLNKKIEIRYAEILSWFKKWFGDSK